MSLIKPIDLTGMPAIREAVSAVISGKFERIGFTEVINMRIQRGDDSAEITITDGKAEVKLSGLPDPDILSVKCYRNYAIVSLTLTNVRVDY